MLRLLAILFCLLGCSPLWGQTLVEYPPALCTLPVVQNGQWGYIDTCGEWVLKPRFQQASFFNLNGYAIVKQNGHYSTLDSQFKLRFAADTLIPAGDLVIAGTQGRYGIFNLLGQVILPPDYESIKPFGTYFLAEKQGKSVLVDKTGKMLIANPFQYIHAFSVNRLLVYDEGKFGLYKNSGEEILSRDCEEIGRHNDSIVRFRKNGYWGYLRYDNSLLAAPHWEDLEMISPELCKLKIDHGYTLMNYKTGKTISDDYADYFDGKDGLVVVKDYQNQVGAINYKNQVVIPLQYEELTLLNEKFFIYGQGGKYGVLDSLGQVVLPPLFSLVEEYYTYDMMKMVGANKQFFRLYENFMVGLANSKGQVLIPPRYTDISIRTDNFYITNFRSSFGLFNSEGKELFPTEFEYISRVEDGLITARVGDCYAIANADTLLSGAINDKIVVENHVAKLYRDGNIEILELDKQGKVQYRYTYDNIPSINVAVRDLVPPNMVPFNSNRFMSEFFEWKFYQPTGKWGVMDLKTNSWYKKPCYDKIHRTIYDRIWITEVNTDTVVVDMAGIRFATTKLYGTYNLYEGAEERAPEFVYLDMPTRFENGFGMHTNSTGFDPGLHKSGVFMFAAEWGSDRTHPISFIGERDRDIRRFNSKGTLVANADSSTKTFTSADEFYYRLNRQCPISFADEASKKALFEGKTYFGSNSGKWHYRAINASNTLDAFNQSFFGAAEEPVGNYLVVKQGNMGVFNRVNQKVLPTNYQSIKVYPFGETQAVFVIADNNSFFGFLDENGTGLNEDYEAALPYKEGMAAVMKNGLWGFIDKTGKMHIAAKYEEVGSFNEGLAWAKMDDKYGYINAQGQEVIPFIYKKASPFKHGLAVVKEGSKYGCINNSGAYAIPAEYTTDFEFNNAGFAIVKQGDKKGIINTQGQWVLKPKKLKRIELIGNGTLAVTKAKNSLSLYDLKTGKALKAKYDLIEDGGEGMIKEKPKKQSFYAFLDSTGNIAVEPISRQVGEFKGGLAKVYKDKLWGFINTKGEFEVDPVFEEVEDFQNGIAKVVLDGKPILIGNRGRTLTELKGLELLEVIDENLIILKDKNGVFAANKLGQNYSGQHFEDLKYLGKGKFAAKVEGFWGIIDKKGNFGVPAKYAGIDAFSEDFLKMEINPLFGAANNKGEIIVAPTYEKCSPFNSNIFVVEKLGRVGYVKAGNEVLWPLQR